MVTIANLKDNAEQHLDFAKRTARQVYNIVVVEGSILNETDLKNLTIANSRAWAGQTVLNDINGENALYLDEDTANRLLRRFQSSMRKLIASKADAESIGTMYDFITVLELVLKEHDFEE